jgi:hypothetical protein
MPVIEERYDQNKIDSLKRYLKREADKGRARDYEIIVDGFKVVSRTNEVDEFDDYEDEIKDNTRNIAILIYDGAGTNRNTRYSFSLNQDNASPISAKPINGLGGLGEIDEIIQQRLDEKEKDFKISSLEKELEETSQKLSEAEDYHKQLEDEIVRLKEEKPKPHAFSLQLGEIGATVLDGLLKRNIPQLAGILNGFSEPQAAHATTTTEPEVEATFQKKGNAQTSPQLTEQQIGRLRNLELMEQAFNGEQLQVVIAIIQKLIQMPEQVIPVAQFLNLQNDNEHA